MNLSDNVKHIEFGSLNSLKNEIFYGGYFAALGSPSLIISTSIILNIALNLPILVIAYLLPLIVYSYDYYKDIEKDITTKSERAIYLKKKVDRYPLIFGFYIMLLGSLLILFANYSLILFILAIILGGILYNVKLKEFTKKIPAFKNIYTTLTWASGGAFFLPLYCSISINISFIIVFLIIYFRCLINVLFFDLKDIENDKKEELKTLPVLLGKKCTLISLYILNILSFIPLILGVYLKLIPTFVIILVGFVAYGFYYIRKAETATNRELETVSHTLADLEFVLWPIILIMAKFLI